MYMQLISVYLYPNKLDVFTNLQSVGQNERYRKVYNRTVKLYRGVSNRIDLNVKNSDEKSLDVTGYSFVFNLVSPETQELILQLDCQVVDITKGKLFATISESQILDIEPGFYQFSVVRELRTVLSDGTYIATEKRPVYIDSQYGAVSPIEVSGDVFGQPADSFQVSEFNKHVDYSNPADTFYESGIIDGTPETSTPQSLHTFQMYFTNYSGELIIQGSLSNGGNPQTWVNLDTVNLTSETMIYRNITGKYNWFRVKHTPSAGTLDKILYR